MIEKDKCAGSVEIKEMSQQDETAVLSFYRQNLKEFEKFSKFWQWRKDSPSGLMKEKILMAISRGHEIEGCLGLVPVSVSVSGRTVKSAWQLDSVVSPFARGKGIGNKLVAVGNDESELSLAKGTSKAMYGLRKKNGYLDAPNSNLLIRVCRAGNSNGSVLRKVLFSFLGVWSAILPVPCSSKSVKVSEIHGFDDSFDLLDKSVIRGSVFRPHKGKEYLNWRYTECPDKKYSVLRAGNCKTRGVIILSCAGTECEEGWIVDMICGHDDKNTAYSLIQSAVLYFSQKNVERIWCFATHPEARKWFYRFGFIPTNRSPKFTYFSKNKDLNKKLSNCNWDFWHGDGDIELYL